MTPPDRSGTPDDSLLDQRLREALAPPPEQTERIIRQTLSAARAGDGRPVRALRLCRLAPAAALVAILAAALFFSLYSRPRPDAVVSIVNVDGLVIATSEEEERPLVLSGGGEQQSSGIILVRHGDPE